MSTLPSRRVVALIAATLLLLIAAILVATRLDHWIATAPPPGEAQVGGPFTLTAHDGRRVSNADFRGRYMLIFFGFTYCPDACPTALATLAAALERLGAEGEAIQPILITVDPERDTAEVLRDYVSAFHPRLIGLTGTPEEIANVTGAYKVYVGKGEPDAAGDYLVDHSSAFFLMDPEGRFLTLFSGQTDVEALVAGLEQYVR